MLLNVTLGLSKFKIIMQSFVSSRIITVVIINTEFSLDSWIKKL